MSRRFAVEAIASATASSALAEASKEGLAVSRGPFLVQVAPLGFALFFFWGLGDGRERDLGSWRLLTLHVLHIVSFFELGLEPVDKGKDLFEVLLMEIVSTVLDL